MKALLNGKPIELGEVTVDGVDTKDYPDFCDAFISDAWDEEGNWLDDEECAALTEENPELVNQLAFEKYL